MLPMPAWTRRKRCACVCMCMCVCVCVCVCVFGRKDNVANAGMDQTEKVCAALNSAVVLCLV
jgi:hypothetical protein